ncbi:choice-of-anchor J domain-containing protein [Epilithonimonas sp. UC225_85]|uniref:choice-of-anchor J domain-containing protein n=1 Tax=Epilithonimonas sp. UC225_85 TaxID=3350167 RepID=UPI0036D328F0
MYIDGTGGQNYVQAYSFMFPNVAAYVISPQIVAPDGSTKITFTSAQTTGSAGTGTVQVGLVSGTTTADMTGFTPLGAAITLASTTENTYTFDVPASAQQYIAFKFIGSIAHAALHVDNVVYGPNLAVVENALNSNDVKFAVSADNNSLKFTSPSTLSSAKIYSAAGQLATEGKITDNTFDITRLKTGIYYILIEGTNGKINKSKFIKK